MIRMSGVDAAFWFAETRNWHMHFGALGICDASRSPDFGFESVRRHVELRIEAMPQLRFRVVGGVLGLSRPWFVEDTDVDLSHHLRCISIDPPGGRVELEDLVGRLWSSPLDRSKPLWEMWFIEGLEYGRVAILTKLHHALADGMSGAGILQELFCAAPPGSSALASICAEAQDQRPSIRLQIIEAIANVAVATPYRLVRLTDQTIRQQVALIGVAERPPHYFQAPSTRFNRSIASSRRVSGSRVALDRIKNVGELHGVKINDVVLAVISGAMRLYLNTRGELPEQPLVAQVPISTRTDDLKLGNKISSMTICLGTHLPDARDRISMISRSSQVGKVVARKIAEHQAFGLTEVAPPAVLRLATKVYSVSRIGANFAPINVVISNVPGPEDFLHVGGVPLDQFTPIGPLLMDVGLNITCVSYCGWMQFGFTTTPESASDIDELADLIDCALVELEEEQ